MTLHNAIVPPGDGAVSCRYQIVVPTADNCAGDGGSVRPTPTHRSGIATGDVNMSPAHSGEIVTGNVAVTPAHGGYSTAGGVAVTPANCAVVKGHPIGGATCTPAADGRTVRAGRHAVATVTTDKVGTGGIRLYTQSAVAVHM